MQLFLFIVLFYKKKKKEVRMLSMSYDTKGIGKISYKNKKFNYHKLILISNVTF